MSLTGSVLLLAPLVAMVLLGQPKHVLAALFIATIFPSASPVNLGSFGVKLFFLVATAFFARVFFLSARQAFVVPRSFGYFYFPFFCFAVVAAVSAIVLPRLFEGATFVLNPRDGIQIGVASVLAPSGTNLNQLVYLLFNTILIGILPLYVYNFSSMREFGQAATWTLVTAIFFIVLQFVPSGPAILELVAWTDVIIGGGITSEGDGSITRLVGPFTESSFMSFWVSAAFGYAFVLAALTRRMSASLIAASLGLILIFSTSSSGYLGIVSVGAFFVFVIAPLYRIRFSTVFRVFFLAGLAMTPVLLFYFSLIMQYLDYAVFGKLGSASFLFRLYSDLVALQALLDTSFAGVGLGSHRSSSGIMTILANTGVLGFAVFAWAYVRLFGAFRHAGDLIAATSGARADQVLSLFPAGYAALATMLVVFAVSVSDISNPLFPFLTAMGIWWSILVMDAIAPDAYRAAQNGGGRVTAAR